jgi:hypothetical protein
MIGTLGPCHSGCPTRPLRPTVEPNAGICAGAVRGLGLLPKAEIEG